MDHAQIIQPCHLTPHSAGVPFLPEKPRNCRQKRRGAAARAAANPETRRSTRASSSLSHVKTELLKILLHSWGSEDSVNLREMPMQRHIACEPLCRHELTAPVKGEKMKLGSLSSGSQSFTETPG
jgi:hypothetical protein